MLKNLAAPVLLGALAASCMGSIDDGDSGDARMFPDETGGGGPGLPPDQLPTRTGIRRLTKSEVRTTIQDLVGIDPNTMSVFKNGWPEDSQPFDTYYDKQVSNLPVIQAAISLS